uniref:protein adenylyltransferase SelO family protein n=1 Tax=Pseudomonas aeruginosa TaxID=287 RepID=UPI003557007D
PRAEPGAIVCRVSPSFLRFGSFELPASRGETALLQQLVDSAPAAVSTGTGRAAP